MLVVIISGMVKVRVRCFVVIGGVRVRVRDSARASASRLNSGRFVVAELP